MTRPALGFIAYPMLLIVLLFGGIVGNVVKVSHPSAGLSQPSCPIRVVPVQALNLREGPPDIESGALMRDIGDVSAGREYAGDRIVRDWVHLCMPDGWVNGSDKYVTFLSVNTPTPLPTLRPLPTPTRIPSSTPTPEYVWVFVDVDGSGDYETVLRCAVPCQVEVRQKP